MPDIGEIPYSVCTIFLLAGFMAKWIKGSYAMTPPPPCLSPIRRLLLPVSSLLLMLCTPNGEP